MSTAVVLHVSSDTKEEPDMSWVLDNGDYSEMLVVAENIITTQYLASGVEPSKFQFEKRVSFDDLSNAFGALGWYVEDEQIAALLEELR